MVWQSDFVILIGSYGEIRLSLFLIENVQLWSGQCTGAVWVFD
jgi:hypothetical protein